MARKLARLTLDNLGDLPVACQSCTFWELDPVRSARAQAAGESAAEKQGWVSRVLLEWGSCGRVAYVDGDPAGYVLYAPPAFLPGADVFATAPASEDAVLLATAWVSPEHSGGGLGRVLMQSVAKDLLKRGGIRAIEAFGDTRNRGTRGLGNGPGGVHSCVLPVDYLVRVGFKTYRPHPRNPRMRLDLSTVLTWREEVESALERLVGVVRPAPAPTPDHRTLPVVRTSGRPGDPRV